MNVSKKIVLGVAVSFFSTFAMAQSVEQGIVSIDSHKYAQAKKNFEALVASQPTAENYFYLGNAFLTQEEPDYAKATEYFNKGLAADKKSFLNKIGLATVKLGKGDKSGVAQIQAAVTESKEKDAEVLFRAGEALTMYEKTNNPDLAIQYIETAIEKSKKGVPANYYYSLGDAYRLKRLAGNAMTAYEKALTVAKNKASVYTRMGTLWMAADKWQLAKENLDKAVQADASYAPAYKALAAYNNRFQKNADAAMNLVNYAKYADEDPNTQLEIAKLFFVSNDFLNAKNTLNHVFDKVSDPIKFKLLGLIQYGEGDYANAKKNLESFTSQAEANRITAADKAVISLANVGIAKAANNEAGKATALADAQQKIAAAKAAKDTTLNWDDELAKIVAGGAVSQADIDKGPSSAEIVALKSKVAANAQDTDALYKLALEYEKVKNWDGAVHSWQKMSTLLPDWSPAYYSLANAYNQAGKSDLAKMNYEKFITHTKPADVEANKQPLSFAYFAVAAMEKATNPTKAKEFVTKSLELNPTYQDAINLSKQLQ